MINVVIADDHSIVRRGFRQVMEEEPDIRVVGEAADGPQLLAWLRQGHDAGLGSHERDGPGGAFESNFVDPGF